MNDYHMTNTMGIYCTYVCCMYCTADDASLRCVLYRTVRTIGRNRMTDDFTHSVGEGTTKEPAIGSKSVRHRLHCAFKSCGIPGEDNRLRYEAYSSSLGDWYRTLCADVLTPLPKMCTVRCRSKNEFNEVLPSSSKVVLMYSLMHSRPSDTRRQMQAVH